MHVHLALLPGMINLFPLLFLTRQRIESGYSIRRAALVTGLMGAARFGIPHVIVGLLEAQVPGALVNPSCPVVFFFHIPFLVLAGLFVWFISLAVGLSQTRR